MEKRGWRVVFTGLILVLLVTPWVIAAQKIILKKGESTLVNGKNITLVGIEGEIANFRVDGEVGAVPKGGSGKISGVEINVTGISINPTIAILNVSVAFMCGDNNCELSSGEGPTFCCRDCGCLSPQDVCLNNICLQNITLPTATYECQQDSDCNLTTTSTLCMHAYCDKSYIPYRCATQKITACREGDSCCPIGCTEEADKDCTTVDMCYTQIDCDDKNPCTQESCDGTPKRCMQERIGACIVNGICLTEGEKQEMRYCDASGELKFLRDTNILCDHDYECITRSCLLKKCRTVTTTIFFSVFIASLLLVIVMIGLYVYATAKQERQKKR